MSAELILQGIVTVIALGITAQWMAWRFRLPSILLLLVFGFVAGPVTGLLSPVALQGEWVFSFVSLAIGIILFEGGLTLRVNELREVGQAVFNLITVGVAVTWMLATVGAYYLVGFGLEMALLVGAILTVTGPTVVGPLLRHVRPTGRVGTIAKWEGITIDPVGAILAVLVFEAILLVHEPGGAAGGLTTQAAIHTAKGLLTVIVVGVGVSVLGAGALILLIRRGLLPDHLLNALSLMVVVTAFALSNILFHESGLLATTLLGIIMANQPFVPVRRIVEFKEDLQVLLIACLFIVLSARLDLAALDYINTGALLFLAALILVVRPFAVWVSSWGTPLDWREWTFLSWLAPRGIVAAAVASLFALRLEEILPGGQVERLVPVVFLVIVGTAATYGLTLAPLARRLGLAQPSPQGVLLVGGHAWARQIAKALQAVDFPVMLVDSNRRNVEQARAEGLRAERTNVLGEHAIDDLDLSGIGRLLAMTPNDEVNSLAALHFAEVFESAEIYQLAVRPEQARAAVDAELPRHLRGRPLFGKDITYVSMSERFNEGGRLRFFNITGDLGLHEVERHYGRGRVVPLFLKRHGDLMLFSAETDAVSQPGDCLAALVPAMPEGEAPRHGADEAGEWEEAHRPEALWRKQRQEEATSKTSPAVEAEAPDSEEEAAAEAPPEAPAPGRSEEAGAAPGASGNGASGNGASGSEEPPDAEPASSSRTS